MLTKEDLATNFSGVCELGQGVFKCLDELPQKTYFNYIKFGAINDSGPDLLLVSENIEDDVFASIVFSSLSSINYADTLQLTILPENGYGFTNVVLAGPSYHRHFKGRLDEKRDNLLLCIPSYQCEFTATESIEDFFLVRRYITPSEDWHRSQSPIIRLRCDNPKTQSGTGEETVLVRFSNLVSEIGMLSGVSNGYIEISNYENRAIEILSPSIDEFILIRERDDQTRETITHQNLLDSVWKFLVTTV
ncbi:hypothetical protein [Undibacterium pigrum]|uniref:Uncharacterized protein n=1 Tax=Undibacterium pigrum TaxID=401470 RepID=A0A318J794_9BURK|nr:hypothetical protein [Undibacterium pigrum]PXX44949.1 hypothetical protein DFR42_102161 [Undibacterium pigrum]